MASLDSINLEGLRAYLNLTAGDAPNALLTPALAGAKAFVKKNYPNAVADPADVPDDVVDAIYTLAARRYHERNSGYADVIDAGGMPVWTRALPSSVLVVLEPYAGVKAGFF